MRRGALPNFLYIGPDKAGSSWLHRVLAWHPGTHVTPAKDLYFFDRHYDRGLDWYARQFRSAASETVVAEISHDYLYSAAAAERIARDLPDVRLMVCLREPVERSFSAYLYMLATGYFEGSFEEAVARFPFLLDHGRYASLLEPYLGLFGRDRIHVAVFDDLREDAQAFAEDLFRFLGVRPLELPEELLGRARPASRPRSPRLSRLVRLGAALVRGGGFPRWVGVLKSSPLVQRALFRPYEPESRPRLGDSDRERLCGRFAEEVRRLESLAGVEVVERWGYRSSNGTPP